MIPFIIAEIGVNHDGSVEKAFRLIDEAKRIGADAVKFQSFSAARISASTTPKVRYQMVRDIERSHFEMLAALELSFSEQEKISKYCKGVDIEFFSTPYSVEDAIFLNEIGVKRFKTASADVVDIPLHRQLSQFGKQVIASTGMANLEEISAMVEIYKLNNIELVLMHATSEYPAALRNSNLAKLKMLKEFNPNFLGFSDHTECSLAAQMAAALGCIYFEKHFTLDRTDTGPDHAASLDSRGFEKYILDLRESFLILGSENPCLSPAELDMSRTSRKSLHLRLDLKQGHVLTEGDFILLRPGTGSLYSVLPSLLGRTLTRDVTANEIFDSTMVETRITSR